MMSLLRTIRKDMRTQRHLLSTYRKALKELPAGRLSFKIMNGKIRYFQWDKKNQKQVYIRANNMILVQKLKYRRILEESIRTMEQNLRLQEKLLQKYKEYDPLSCQSRLGKAYQDLPEEFFHQPKNKIKQSGCHYRYHPEQLIHVASFGMKFRSKSEAFIAELLHHAKIPFLYEEEIILTDENGEKHKYLPDFTIILPDGSHILWEHFGRMDLPDYRRKNFNKLAVYHYNGIYPPKNLIITMDSPNGGIDIDAIQDIITALLLPLFQNEG